MAKGQPFTDEHKADYVRRIQRGEGRATAAGRMGFSWGTVRKHLTEDAEFREACEMAALVRDEAVEEVVYEEALNGSPNAYKFWLTNRRPEDWVDGTRRVELTGAGGSPLAIAVDTTQALRAALTDPSTRSAALDIVCELEGDIVDAEVVW